MDLNSKESKKSFKDTLNLPKTDFPIRPNAQVDDLNLVNRWQKENLFKKSFDLNKDAQKFILHDGPPYANGPIHLGHAYNKILKDILCKVYRMLGYNVPVTPGWDCHGLPIEQKVAAENPNLSRSQLMKACRQYAHKWIDNQRESFKRLGVLMDWDHPYITMDCHYEALTVKAFGILVANGFIERKNKTVAWCAYDQTVLASAEIEYKDRKDPSIYVLFPLVSEIQQIYWPEIKESISFLIWTTTPWTLPLNRAIILKPNESYSIVRFKDTLCIVGTQVVSQLEKIFDLQGQIILSFNSNLLSGSWALHPFIEQKTPILFDESVGVQEGTACVHSAPGCGPIDYEIGVKNNLEIYSPISSSGKYTKEIKPTELIDMPVTQGQIWVIKKLSELNKLLHKTSITHSYPHCWRCHNGLIFRATAQWFFDLDRNNVKQHALTAINNINFIPSAGRNFLKATVETRWEWCLSRQRVWGTPIPAILCLDCDNAFTSSEFINKIAQGIEKEGIEYWADVKLEEVLPKDLKCNSCGASNWKKEYDILDVWFDSGVSHFAVLYKNPELQFPADVYLEGLDQHRGWFQSSLLTSLVLEKEACMKTIMTHGYTVDSKGQKMSKSLGNVVSPDDIIAKLGTDGLRLWVSSVGNDSDPSVSDVLMANVSEVYRKIRNTSRFLLSNLYDFNFDIDCVSSKDLLPVDRYALINLYYINDKVIEFYKAADFTQVFHTLADYCSSELSSFYLDITKDRLYVEKNDGNKRRSAQTVYWYLLDTLTKLTAPILSFTSEYLSDNYQKDKKESIHLQKFVDSKKIQTMAWSFLDPESENIPLNRVEYNMEKSNFTIKHRGGHFSQISKQIGEYNQEELYLKQWQEIKEIRSMVLKAIENEREKGIIKHSLEAKVDLFIDFENNRFKELKTLISSFITPVYSLEDFFKELLIVSQLNFHSSKGNLQSTTNLAVFVSVSHAVGTKCPRCWQWDTITNEDDLCRRCQSVFS